MLGIKKRWALREIFVTPERMRRGGKYFLSFYIGLFSHIALPSTTLKPNNLTTTSPLALEAKLSLGKNLDAAKPASALLVEPSIAYTLNEKHTLSGALSLSRPLDAYENFSLPLIYLKYAYRINHSLVPLTLSFKNSLREIDRWNADGVMIRPQLEAQIQTTFFSTLTTSLRVGPYYQFNRYTQRTNGKDLPNWGFTQRLTLEYQFAKFRFEFLISLEQQHRTLWRNFYTTYEAISYEVFEHFYWGISHELLSTWVDSTGTYSTIRFGDSRDSRISTFINWTM